MVKFSQDSLLKQEEALAELDASIDDWVNKLEQAENRRTRVRQKLLEHVAAAVILPGATGSTGGASGALQLALGLSTPAIPPNNISTPPRSPTRSAHTASSSSSPHRVVAQVPSTITEHPLVEEAAVGLGINQAESQKTDAKKDEANEPLTAGIRRADVESIRIYAGDEVAALLADVEQQITRMSKASEVNAALREKDAAALREKEATGVSEQERRELHRAASQEALQGGPDSHSHSSSSDTPKSSTTPTPRSATPPAAEAKSEDHPEFILSAAVFNPQAAFAH